MASAFVDDKTPLCIPFILENFEAHRERHQDVPSRPFIVGINGVQGAGKTTLVKNLEKELSEKGFETLVCSIDDFYKTREDQVKLAKERSENALYQHRGVPGTHDTGLLQSFVDDVLAGKPTSIPVYDKSLHQGQGDRAPSSTWHHVTKAPQILILEGWCVGFHALSPSSLQSAYTLPSRTLSHHAISHLTHMNESLAPYEKIWALMDAFVHIDAEDTTWVYEWRQEQEDALRREKGDESAGMSKEEVVRFVDGYYPAYELYTEDLRKGLFRGRKGYEGRHLRLIVGRDRKVKQVVRI